MKFSEYWLREWVELPPDIDALTEQLTLLGLEVDAVEPAAPELDEVVVARVLDVEPHPNANRLTVCRVDDGGGEALQVVCGAPNVRSGLVAPLARIGARLPGGARIAATTLRGVESRGMLCSAAELGLAEQREGLMELEETAEPGQTLSAHLSLDDRIITIELTPNRGDCLSLRGIARDLSARNDRPVSLQVIDAPAPVHADTVPVSVHPASACVRYAGCLVRDVATAAVSPPWLVERLRRSGLRPISAVVDITNYVMLELGQPMHAFDSDRLIGGIQVRLAEEGEPLSLLDGRDVELAGDTTVIADDRGAIGIGGIMGGASTAVDEQTQNIFFEAALFLPEHINGKSRRYQAPSESAHRFERGVDPQGQVQAIERAIALLVAIAGGRPGPIVDWCDESRLPLGKAIRLRRDRLDRLLGIPLEADEIERILSRLEVRVEADDDGWQVTPPSHRYDLRIEEDYIEELARVHGYDRLPRTSPAHRPVFRPLPEDRVTLSAIRHQLVDRGYQEVVTYSFVDHDRQRALRPELDALPLANPISRELGVMRTTLIGGLLDTMRHNQSRQLRSMRLFESGLRFLPVDGDTPPDSVIDAEHGHDIQLGNALMQQTMLAGLAVGEREREHWQGGRETVDFFDVKADVEALLTRAGRYPVRFEPLDIPLLHPGQAASIVIGERRVGLLGRLHPGLQKVLDLGELPVVFECTLEALLAGRLRSAAPVSRFPRVRRDVSLLVDRSISHATVLDCVRRHAPEWLVDVVTFDIYQGGKIDKTSKSIALGLIMQHLSRTLEDAEIEAAVQGIVAAAHAELGAVLRA